MQLVKDAMKCMECERTFSELMDYCPFCSNPSEGFWQMLRRVERTEYVGESK